MYVCVRVFMSAWGWADLSNLNSILDCFCHFLMTID